MSNVIFALTSDMIPALSYPVASFSAPEQNMIEWAAQFLQPGKLFIDIGAHIGTYSLQYASRGFDVVAFEATSITYEALCLGIKINNFSSRVCAHNIALSRLHGVAEIRSVSNDGGGNSILNLSSHTNPISRERIDSESLDSFDLKNIGLIKIDVEGAELDVICGALRTLERSDYPDIIFESWRPSRMSEAAKLRSELFAKIQSLGYIIVPLSGYDEIFLATKVRF